MPSAKCKKMLMTIIATIIIVIIVVNISRKRFAQGRAFSRTQWMCGWLVGMAKIYCGGRFIWTAGYWTDHRNKNGFVWKLNNGVSVPLRYTNWMRNEPNNWRGTCLEAGRNVSAFLHTPNTCGLKTNVHMHVPSRFSLVSGMLTSVRRNDASSVRKSKADRHTKQWHNIETVST